MTMAMVSGVRVSTSVPVSAMSTDVSSSVVTGAGVVATGASLTGRTVIATVAGKESRAVSLSLKVKLSGPE